MELVGDTMEFTKLARQIDRINTFIADKASWTLLLAVFIFVLVLPWQATSSRQAPTLGMSFNGICMVPSSPFSAPYTLRRNEHAHRRHRSSFFQTHQVDRCLRVRFLLAPDDTADFVFEVPFAFESIRNQEMSNNAGGLICLASQINDSIGLSSVEFARRV